MLKYIQKSLRILVKPPFMIHNYVLTQKYPILPPQITTIPRFSMANKKIFWKNKDYVLTQQIKRTKTSEQLYGIIKKRGAFMNLINLTAVLDRMQEQRMINTGQIVDFVVDKIKSFSDIFEKPLSEEVRAICNIICYIGNIKNTDLNFMFERVDVDTILKFCNNIEKMMFITGIIRLGIFDRIFRVGKDKQESKLPIFNQNMVKGFELNHLLSIWIAFYFQKMLKDQELKMFMIKLIDNALKTMDRNRINLRTYTYLLVCYTQDFKNLEKQYLVDIIKILKHNIPLSASSKQYLVSHELSLLLKSIKKLKQNDGMTKKLILNMQFSEEFLEILNKNINHICKGKNVTLRNIANIVKGMSQTFKLSQAQMRIIAQTINSILTDEMAQIKKRKENKFDYKIDLLSLSSLCWKVNEFYSQKQVQDEGQIHEVIMNIQRYIIQLKKLNLTDKMTNNEKLMLFSGFYQYFRHSSIDFQRNFPQIVVQMITKTDSQYSVKEITLFYTYLKQMKIANEALCHFIKTYIENQSQQNILKNKVAIKILSHQGCLMDLTSKCVACFKQDKQKVNDSVRSI